MKPKGAFEEAAKWIIGRDFEAKSKLIKDIIDHPEKYPGCEEMNGADFFELIFGDYQRFADKFKEVK